MSQKTQGVVRKSGSLQVRKKDKLFLKDSKLYNAWIAIHPVKNVMAIWLSRYLLTVWSYFEIFNLDECLN